MKNAIYKRQYYIDKIKGFYKSDLIKVISGIRRCGKSCFLISFLGKLKNLTGLSFPQNILESIGSAAFIFPFDSLTSNVMI